MCPQNLLISLAKKNDAKYWVFNEVKQLREEYILKLTVQVKPIIILKQNVEGSVN